MSTSVTVRVPATAANIGPGFDCLGLALDLWNETRFSLEGKKLYMHIEGEGNDQLPGDEENLIYQSLCRVYARVGAVVPPGLRIVAKNDIPLCSGLGSSAAATLTGVLGANALLGNPLDEKAIIQLCTQIEGHPDNVSPAYFGGLTVSIQNDEEVISRRIPIPTWQVVVLLPDVVLSTENSRLAVPKVVAMTDAVFNIGHTVLVVEALRSGELVLLMEALQDRLHQPYRLQLITGAGEAIQAARDSGIPAALSGAGPSVVAFCDELTFVSNAMQKAFCQKGVTTRSFSLATTKTGAWVEIE